MKRLAIFALLAPLIATWVGRTVTEGFSLPALWLGTLITFPYIYLIGLAPALLVCMLDASLRVSTIWRVVCCAIAGYAGSYVFFLFSKNWMQGADIPLWGLGGLVAGAVCSWLSGRAK